MNVRFLCKFSEKGAKKFTAMYLPTENIFNARNMIPRDYNHIVTYYNKKIFTEAGICLSVFQYDNAFADELSGATAFSSALDSGASAMEQF